MYWKFLIGSDTLLVLILGIGDLILSIGDLILAIGQIFYYKTNM